MGFHILIQGRVQGVGFRYYTHKEAKRLGLRGTVKNTSEGNVEIFVSGNQKDLEKFISWCNLGSPASEVTEVKVSAVDYIALNNIFEIIR